MDNHQLAKKDGYLNAGGTIGLPQNRRTFALCLAASAVEGYDMQALGVVGPKLMVALQLTPIELGWAISINTIGLFLGAILGGRLADEWGRKPILVTAMLLYGLATWATTYSDGLNFLVWCRILTGLGLGAAMPILIALTAEASTTEQRTERVTTMAAGMSFGAIVAALPSLFMPVFDWRIIFYIGGALPVVVALVIMVLLKEHDHKVVVASKLMKTGYAELFRGGRSQITLALWASFLFCMMVLWMLFNWLPTLLVAAGHSIRDAALAILVFNIGGMFGAIGLGRLASSVRRDWLAGAAFGGVAIGTLMLATNLAVIPAALILGLFITGAQFLLYGLSSESYPAGCRATGVGAAMSVGRVGSFLGPLLAGGLLGSGGSPRLVLLLLIPLIVVAGGCAALLAHLQRDAF